jgi:hypothetical protein
VKLAKIVGDGFQSGRVKLFGFLGSHISRGFYIAILIVGGGFSNHFDHQ